MIVTAATLRFWQLGQLPPGLYRDEAMNGLDALSVLEGQHALFFAANNGREPAYIYLTALSIAIFGRSALAVRLAAAVIGTLATLPIYQMAATWFDRRTGLLAAWVWAITLWPVHLSRLGLRPILLVPLLALTFWLGTLAYRRQERRLWLLAGAVYGVAFYTYLAVRFTPLLLLLFLLYLVWSGRGRELWPGVLWFGAGAVVVVAPLAVLAWQQPQLVLGRANQVSILSPTINGGHLWRALWQQAGRGLGLFLWQGDTILRHNPAGRPVFDLFMALPFLAGLSWCLWRWRRPAAMLLLLWTGVMLGPTVLAEDTPHFLRAVGLLPAVVILPAIGLAQLWTWSRLSTKVGQPLVIMLAVASLIVTVVDYVAYGRQPEVAFLFQAAATDMARQINAEPVGTTVFIDERFWDERFAAIPFLVRQQPVKFNPQSGLPLQPAVPAAIYAWPYGPLDFIPQVLTPPALVSVETGSLARDDLEATPYPLYVRYTWQTAPDGWTSLANFDNQVQLQQATLTTLDEATLQVDLYWTTATALTQDTVAFVHVVGPDGLVGQHDGPPAGGHWPRQWWQPGLIVHDRHRVRLPEPYDRSRHRIDVGLYDAQTQVRLPILAVDGKLIGYTWQLHPPTGRG
ncbi:MAG TPA: glycosyltransferase family 39 protein [Anaerolineae bacterium]